MSDALGNGRRFRALPILDDFSRESVYIEVGSHFRGIQIAQTLARVGPAAIGAKENQGR